MDPYDFPAAMVATMIAFGVIARTRYLRRVDPTQKREETFAFVMACIGFAVFYFFAGNPFVWDVIATLLGMFIVSVLVLLGGAAIARLREAWSRL